ncbi:MAG: CPBP family glutamic-type intramembrane protease [Verrucomicrobiales bacterium]|nr:CPBP family glutamic-type intramembrane protease [Verrucomicrobiales bacterium]
MGKFISEITSGLFLFIVLAANLARAEEKHSDQLSFSIQSNQDRERIWGIRYPKGKKQDLSPEEERKLLEETIFPQVLKDAESGIEPHVWQVGFFHLDGIGTPQDIAKAEAAFRVGLDLNHPEGLYLLGEYFQEQGIAAEGNEALQKAHFLRAEGIYKEVLEAGFTSASRSAIPLAQAHLFGWYGLEKDPAQADSILTFVEKALPASSTCLLWRAKVFAHQEKFDKAFDYAERAQKGFQERPEQSVDLEEDLKMAGAVKITAAVLGGQISRIDPKEFLETSKSALGITGRGAWFVPLILLIVLSILFWRTRLTWSKEEKPGLRLSIAWLSIAVLAAGIGFNITLPGLNNGFGHWIGAILVTLTCLALLASGGWSRLFGTGPFVTGWKPFLSGLGIIIGGIVGLQLIANGYSHLYEILLDRPLGKQIASLFLKSEGTLQLLGTLSIVGIAIPFYEEIFFRGFLYDALEKRWTTKVALIASSMIFAIVHGLTFFIPLLFLSFILGWLRMKNGNLRMCFLLHAANNSFAVLIGHFSGS